MKRILLLIALVIVTNVVIAQIQQRNWLMGGSVSFYHDKYGDEKETGLSLSPDIGYFFINNLAGGLRVNLETWSLKEEGSSDWNGTDFSVAPFARYYFLPAKQKVNFFADASYRIGSHTSDYGESGENTYNIHGFAFKAGPAIFLTPHTALEITLGYNNTKWEDDEEATNTIQLGIGFQIHIGGAK